MGTSISIFVRQLHTYIRKSQYEQDENLKHSDEGFLPKLLNPADIYALVSHIDGLSGAFAKLNRAVSDPIRHGGLIVNRNSLSRVTMSIIDLLKKSGQAVLLKLMDMLRSYARKLLKLCIPKSILQRILAWKRNLLLMMQEPTFGKTPDTEVMEVHAGKGVRPD
ncbi:hypothetical protein FCM35_KLT04781 [Carex littledalei]|uniref:Uncharacterized protein n=1 Tax=Carex littledalei TaxID=544730 RepID=A0A833QM70_9POAL|nr:hypothetical protein FCM35_KLT04781 [Carex littledalei]